MKQRDAHKLVRNETEIRELLFNLRIRFSWAFIALSPDVNEQLDEFMLAVKRNPETMAYSTNSFGRGNN